MQNSDGFVSSADQLLRVLTIRDPWISINPTDLFPSERELDHMLGALPSTPWNASLAVLDPLVPPTSQYTPYDCLEDISYDVQGLCKYARIVNAILLCLVEDRQAARHHVWALKHILALALYAQETIQYQGVDEDNPIFANVAVSDLQRIATRAQQVTAYLLSVSSIETGWSEKVVNSILAGERQKKMTDVGEVVYALIKHTKGRM